MGWYWPSGGSAPWSDDLAKNERRNRTEARNAWLPVLLYPRIADQADAMPNRKNRQAAVTRSHRAWTFVASRSPRNTASPSVAIMPRVVPSVTVMALWKRAPSATVANWVLSPISARKNSTTVVSSGPKRAGLSSSSRVSGRRVHSPKPMNVAARIPAMALAGMCAEIQTPTDDASAWLASVASRMPAMTVHGRRYLLANENAKSWVLSPISLAATSVKLLKTASQFILLKVYPTALGRA